MTIRTATAAANAALDACYDRANAGSGPGTIKVYSGSQVATGDTTETGTLLATFTLEDPAFSAASARVKDLDAAPDLSTTAVGTGTAGWARCEDSDGNNVFDGSVGTSGTDYIINNTSVTTGQTVTLTLGAITAPA